MKSAISAALAGMLFGSGLVLAQMTQPAKIHGFLDFFGAWDPSLAFVMLGAIAVHLPGYQWLNRRRRLRIASAIPRPPKKPIDAQLLFGATLFGVGWGITGYCPGPAIAACATSMSALVVLASMLAGST